MTIYDDAQEIAAEVLTEFRQGVISIIKITPGTGPDHNPGPSTESPPIRIFAAVARGIRFKYVAQGLGVATDMQVTMAANEIEPTERDFFEVDGERLKVVSIIRRPAAGTVVSYTVILRRNA